MPRARSTSPSQSAAQAARGGLGLALAGAILQMPPRWHLRLHSPCAASWSAPRAPALFWPGGAGALFLALVARVEKKTAVMRPRTLLYF